MNETTEKKQEGQFDEEQKDGEVFISQEYQDFKDAKALFESDKAKKDLKITYLQGEIAKEAKKNVDLVNQLENETKRRIKAENQVAEMKNLGKNPSVGYKHKTEEERFAENYQKAKERLAK
jgi:hypothetical protein